MPALLGRIRRISLDAGTPENYTLASTTFYDNGDPTASTGPWGTGDADVAAMDVPLSTPTPPALEVAHPGALIEFARQPFRFHGVTVKVRPTYDSTIGEDPALEMWTQQLGSNVYTLRRRIPFASLIGTPSGRVKYFDLSLAVPLANVARVWVVMNPGTVGNPTMTFLAIHCFGQCRLVPVTPGSCYDDPTTDCLGAGECEDNVETCLDPPLDCEDFAPEVCDLPPFDWPKAPPEEGGPTPRFEPPTFPTIDLCDADAIEAYKDELTPEQLAYLEDLLDQAELPCLDPEDRSPNPVAPINADADLNPILPRQPVEVYVNPETGEPEQDPQGNGSGDGDATYAVAISRYVFMFFDEAERDRFVETLDQVEDADVQAAWNDPFKQVYLWGNGVGGPGTPGAGYIQNAPDRIVFRIHGVGKGDVIKISGLRRSGSFGYNEDTTPPHFTSFPASKIGSSFGASTIVDWLFERGSRLAALPGASVEAGGDPSATESQTQSIVTSGDGAVTWTFITAYDDFNRFTSQPSESVETQILNVRKHLQFGNDPDPPHDPIHACLNYGYLFRFTVTKRLDAFSPDAYLTPTMAGQTQIIASFAQVQVSFTVSTVTE